MKKKWIPGLLDIGQHFDNQKIFKLGLDYLKFFFSIANMPGIRHFHPWMQTEKTNMYWIPVNKTLYRTEDVPLPYEVVSEFIEKSTYRAIVDFCGCRKGNQCKNFPDDIGCLMMGDDAKRIPSKISRSATKEEAHEHLKKAIEAGLPPFIGKARIDNYIFGVPDNGKLLTVCFCCSCCCITSILKDVPAVERNQMVHRLEGLEIEIDQKTCKGCGQCLEHCYIQAISIHDDKAQIDSHECRGCGRCVSSCTTKSIHIQLNNPDFIDQAIESIREYVKA